MKGRSILGRYGKLIDVENILLRGSSKSLQGLRNYVCPTGSHSECVALCGLLAGAAATCGTSHIDP